MLLCILPVTKKWNVTYPQAYFEDPLREEEGDGNW